MGRGQGGGRGLLDMELGGSPGETGRLAPPGPAGSGRARQRSPGHCFGPADTQFPPRVKST